MSAEHFTSPARPVLRMLRMKDVENRTGLKRGRIYQLEAAGRFPKRVKLSDHATAWVEHEVNEFLAARMAERG